MSLCAPRKIGHFFPGGTVDAFDTWLELKGTDDKGQNDLLERHGRRRRQRPSRKGRALLPLAADRCARQSHQQAQCLGHARRGVRAPDSAGRGRHRALSPAHSGERRQQDHAARPAVLPQVRVVEHAVLFRRTARSSSTRTQVTPDYDDRKFTFDCVVERCLGEAREDSRPADRRARGRRSHAARGRAQGIACRRAKDRSASQKTGSAGTTTASDCSCRAI